MGRSECWNTRNGPRAASLKIELAGASAPARKENAPALQSYLLTDMWKDMVERGDASGDRGQSHPLLLRAQSAFSGRYILLETLIAASLSVGHSRKKPYDCVERLSVSLFC